MKVFYYESAAWTEITGLTRLPEPTKRVNAENICTVEVQCDSGSLYAAWVVRNFTEMKVEDDSATIIFQGYLKKKIFTSRSVIFQIVGFASKMGWTEFDRNYILAQGIVKTCPYTFTETATEALHANNQHPYGLCHDGTNFYVCEYESGVRASVFKYTSAWVYVAEYDVSANMTWPFDITFDGTNFYIVDHIPGSDIEKYNNVFVHQETVLNLGSEYFNGVAYMLSLIHI